MRPELLTHCIIYMHDDLNPHVDIMVGYSLTRELVFEMEFDQYDNGPRQPRENWCERIIVEEKGIETLIRKMRTTRKDLPEKCMYTFGIEEESWSANEVFCTFNGIQHYLSGLRIHYRLEREDDPKEKETSLY